MSTRIVVLLAALSGLALGQSISVVAGGGQSTGVGTAFPTNLQAKVTDGSGNAVAGVTVEFTAPGSGASGSFPSGLTGIGTTNAAGIAVAPVLTANGIPGAFNVVARFTLNNDSFFTTPFTLTNLPVVQVTVSTNILGPVVSVDGGPSFTGSQTFTFVAFSVHTVSSTTPQSFNGGLSRYVFQNWSDGQPIAHNFTVPAGPAALIANFGIQHQLTTLVSPIGSGNITPATGFFPSGSNVSVSATAVPSFNFSGFTGALSGTTNPQSVLLNAPATVTANFVPRTVQVTVQTNPNGPVVSVDGGPPFTGSQTFTFNVGSSHSLAAGTPQLFNGGQSRYVFLNWSDAGAATHNITVPPNNATFTATFGIQHLLTTSVSPVGAGTILPGTGFYDQNSVQSVAATANQGYFFAGFSGALTGTTTPQPLTITGPLAVVANFVANNAYQIRYVSNLNLGDGVINITNTGERGAGLAAGTAASVTGSLCANVYAFSPDEQMISCCSCPVTPNGLVSLSARQDLISNTLTPAVPTSIVVKLVASIPQEGSCANSAANVTAAILAPGMQAWGTSVRPAVAGGGVDTVETRFQPATLSIGGPVGIGELARLQQLCTFINANGSGFGICRSCRLGGLGAGRQ